ncbi:uncharacterized protein LOC109099391 [Tachysurus ichikawai]
MAPVCWVRHLSLSCLCVWLPALFLNCYSLITFDYQALLDIRNSVAKSLTNQNTSELDCFFNYAYESIKPPLPECFCRWPLNITRRKRRRKQGNLLTNLCMAAMRFGARWICHTGLHPCIRALIFTVLAVPVSTELVLAPGVEELHTTIYAS